MPLNRTPVEQPAGAPAEDATRERRRAAEIFEGTPPTVADLRGIGLFGGLDESLLAYLADALSVEVYDAGTRIVREGECGRTLYVVLDGEVDVSKTRGDGSHAHLALLGPGCWFGAMAVIDVMPRSATVQAISPVRLLRVRAADLDAIYRRSPKGYALLVMNLARQLSRELRIANAIVAERG